MKFQIIKHFVLSNSSVMSHFTYLVGSHVSIVVDFLFTLFSLDVSKIKTTNKDKTSLRSLPTSRFYKI